MNFDMKAPNNELATTTAKPQLTARDKDGNIVNVDTIELAGIGKAQDTDYSEDQKGN